MADKRWVDGFGAAITVCDTNGIVLDMNEKASKTFAKDGGTELIGKSLIQCHPEPARSKLLKMLKEPSVNCYTIEKNDVKKMIYQAPWHENGEYKGIVEMSFEIPFEMRHFVRKPNQ